MRLRSASFALFSFLAVIAGCSGGSGSSGGGGGACGAYFDAISSLSQKCGFPIASPSHVNDVRTKFLTLCQNELNAPGASKAAGAIQSCADKINAASSCNDIGDCQPPPGDLADGAACGEDFQCQSGSCKIARSSTGAETSQCGTCEPRAAIGADCSNGAKCVEGATCSSSGSGKATCVAKTIGKAGDVCFDPKNPSTHVTCDTGLHCPTPDFTTATPEATKCSAPGAAGAACISRSDCGIGLSCVAKKCAEGLAEGAACTGSGDCAVGLACDLGTKKCAKLTFAAVGQPCDDMVRFCDVGVCVGSSVSGGSNGETTVTPGTCKDPIPDGSPCNEESSKDGRCDQFSECIAGTCQQKNASLCK